MQIRTRNLRRGLEPFWVLVPAGLLGYTYPGRSKIRSELFRPCKSYSVFGSRARYRIMAIPCSFHKLDMRSYR